MNNIYHTASSCQQFEFQICGRTSESQPRFNKLVYKSKSKASTGHYDPSPEV